MPSIKKARDKFGVPDADAIIDYFRGKGEDIPDPAGDAPTGTAFEARIDHGRWIVHCDCGSAQLVDPDDPRLFCVRCFNVSNDRAWRTVDWPEDIAAVEEELEEAPIAEQNWEPNPPSFGPDPDPPVYGTIPPEG